MSLRQQRPAVAPSHRHHRVVGQTMVTTVVMAAEAAEGVVVTEVTRMSRNT